MNRTTCFVLSVSLIVGTSAPLAAQDSARTRLPSVTVTVARGGDRPVMDLPFAIARAELDSTRAMTRRANLGELLFAIPGVSVSQRFNPTQDPRLAIRGFGSRSAFGIRGVRILRDGIPLTLADGQTASDVLDVETTGAAEVMRGAAGALYGNSSGGVIDFRSPEPPVAGSRYSASAFTADGITRLSGSAAAATRWGWWQGIASRNKGDGPRAYSSFESATGFADGRWSLGATRLQTQLTVYSAPRAQNPGALTREEMDTAHFAADPQNVRKKASKSVHQTLVSLAATHPFANGLLTGSVFGGTRSLDNPQAFAIVAFDRASWGSSVRGQYAWDRVRRMQLAVGADLLSQRDDRKNWANCAALTGSARPRATCPTADDRGAISLDQRERVTSLGTYARGEVEVTPHVSLTGALRHDRTEFSVLDRRPSALQFVVAPSRALGAVTPMLGLNWRVGPLGAVYVNAAESFETPTTTEMANQPDGSGGLNRELKPQRGRTYEAGAKGWWGAHLRYDLAVFRIATRDELIPFEIPNSGGRRFFRNVGKTSRSGVEGRVESVGAPLTAGASWSAIRYEYDAYTLTGTSYAGKKVPGVAPLSVSAWLTGQARWGLAALEVAHAARTAADDANSAWAPAYTIMNVRAGFHRGSRIGVEPSVGVDNVFDKTYAANIVTNAARARFFEPGAGRTAWVKVRLGRRDEGRGKKGE